MYQSNNLSTTTIDVPLVVDLLDCRSSSGWCSAPSDLQLAGTLSFSRLLFSVCLLLIVLVRSSAKGFGWFVCELQNVGHQSSSLSSSLAQEQSSRAAAESPPSSSSSLLRSKAQQSSSIIKAKAPARVEDFQHPSSASDGIVPVVVTLRRPRRGLTYGLKALVVISYLVDGALICTRAVWNHVWEPSQIPAWGALDWYTSISTIAFLSCGLSMSLEERGSGQLGGWGRGYTRSFAGLAWVGELVIDFLVVRVLTIGYHSAGLDSITDPNSLVIYDILHISNSAFRLILITFLCLSHSKTLWQKEFVPYSPLGDYDEDDDDRTVARRGYGTFTSPSTSANGHVLSTKAQMREPPKPTGVLMMLRRIKVLFPYLWPRRSKALQAIALLCFCLLFVGRGVNLFVPMTLGKATEDLSRGTSPWLNLGLFVGLRFLQGSGGIVSVIQQNLWIPVAQYADRSMSMMSFTHLLDLSLSYHTRRKTAEVLRILDRGSSINQFFQLLIFSLVPIFLDITFAAIYLALRFDILLSLMLILVMAAYASTSVVLTQWRTAIRREMVDKDKYTRGIQGDSLLNWETIAWFNTKTFETNRYLDATVDYQRSEFLVMSSLYTLNLVQNAIISVALLIGCFAVAFQVSAGRKTVGDFVLFVSYIGQLIGPLNQLGTLYRVIQQNLTDTDNLMKLLAEPKEIQDRPDAKVVTKAQGNIEFDHVSFSYDGKNQALEDISFSVPAGSSVALVGESGSGKSTILRLLFRFYDPTSGSIKLDGIDIRDLTQASYRSQIGSVPQDAALFNDTIRYNIAYGAIGVKPEGPTMEDVVEAAKAAQIHNRVITFPDGYETRVGERGVRLSGGEKQRVAIARVMIRNPPLIFLDEATSALDTTTEREIQEALNKLGEGRTTVAIAHRLSTIVNSDLILVVDKGKIVERGNHSDLLASKGIYSDLWAKQIRAEVEAGQIGVGSSSAKDKGTLRETDNNNKSIDSSNSNTNLLNVSGENNGTGGTVTPLASTHHHG
ncbi:hypothetical protein BY996DRAFT_8148639 [Phakopsora pachyrhizi]|uniref:Uncharacterized protein n=1 Tax=Phakopsora pachyrhizi TaxID=170000 RepID=A0AAV0BAK8_PHAPC|nr:hypothetical protein BY996DRAFT_8148639 [Phakopsora pachyrhizi]CAH7682830.1 hypothetical protein PPACK8108_LOCUS15960 [Phakopsora pachyrhizi]